MKRKFSILFAALAAILLITPPHFITKAQGQATTGTILWEETWTGGTSGETPSNYGFEGTTVYNQQTLNYLQSSNSTKLYNENYAEGTAPELLLSKSNQTWTIENIPTGQATIMTLTFLSNKTSFSVTSSTTGISIKGSAKEWEISAESNITSFNLTIKNTSPSNARIDNIKLTVKTPSSSPTITLSPTELSDFSYSVGQGPSVADSLTLQGSNLNGIVTLSAQEDYEISKTSEGEYSASLTYTTDEIAEAQTVYVRLKAGLQAGNYGGTITASSTGADIKTINLSGKVSQEFNYNLVLQGSHISRAALKVGETELKENDKIQSGKEVIVVVEVEDGYTYSVSVTNNTTQEPVVVIDDKFTMPASDITVTVTERALQNYTITYYVNGVEYTTQNVIEGNAATLPTENIPVPEGFNFVGWTKNEETAELIPQPFIPTGNTNLYLVFGNTYYEKVKELNDITAGTYIIVNADYCLPNSTTTSSPVKNDEYKVTGASSTDRYYSVPDNTEWTFTGTNTAMDITNSDGKHLYATKSSTGLRVNTTTTPDTWAFEKNETGFAMKDNNNSRYCATYKAGDDWRSYTTKDYTNYADGGVLYLFKKSLYTRVYDASTTTQMENIPSTAIVTVPNGVVFTLTGTNKGSSNNLIIEDGGQLIVNNSGVKATFKKAIEAATPTAKTTEGGWYSIASPVNNVAISSVTNLVDNADHSLRYNLYRYYEPSSVWQAYNTINHADFTTLANGQGYLYRNNGMELSFSGEVNHDNVSIALTNNATNNELKGFNLIGNPFGHNIYKGSGAAIDNNNLSEGFYYLTNNGAWQAGDGSKAITPQMGVLVQVTGEETEVTLTISDNNSQPNTRYANDNLQFIVSNNEYQDVAYAKFSKGYGLNKISHRNSEVPMLYIPQNGERYAIAMMSDNTEMFALNFKAATMGRYTLSYKAEGEFSYLHVIDRLTGDDVDMLLEGEYSFTASPKDNESRFIVRLAYKPDYSNEGNEIFVYQNGDEILVSGEGELQVFDATGRLVRNMSINGAKSLNISTQGVYIFRLVGNEVKTQKIVVR